MQKKYFIAFFLIPFFYSQSVYSLKILVAVYQFPVLAQTFILNHITGLIDRGHKVSIFAQKPGKNIKEQPEVEIYNLLDKTSYEIIPANLDVYDVILCEFGYVGTLFAHVKQEQQFKGKLVTCFRGMDISACIRSQQDRYETLFKEGDLFLPVCDYFKDKLVNLGCDAQKILVHHSSIDCNKFKPGNRTFAQDGVIKIISVNRLVKKKGTDFVVRALAFLRKKNKKLKLHYVIVGNGPYKEKLKRLVEKLGLRDIVQFLGWRERSEIISLLQNSDIFVLPSRTSENGDEEGIPNALKEAMSCGLPVISTYHAGIPELIKDGFSGYLIREKRVLELAEKIEYLIKHQKLCTKFGKRGRKFVKAEHHKTTQLDQLEEILKYLINK